MAVRAGVSSCSIFRSSPPPHLSSFRCRCFHFRPFASHLNPNSLFFSPRLRHLDISLTARCRSSHSLVDIVMEEFRAMRVRKRIRASSKVITMSSRELVAVKVEKWVLQKGLLLEFRKDSERVLLAVAQRPDGKKNWMVSDQVLEV